MTGKYTGQTRDRDGVLVCSISLDGVLVGVTYEDQKEMWVSRHKKLQHSLVGEYKEAEDYEKNKGTMTFKFLFRSKNKDYSSKVYFMITSCGGNFSNMEEDFFLNEESSCISREFFADEPRKLMVEGENDTFKYNGREFKFYTSYGRVVIKEIEHKKEENKKIPRNMPHR